MSGERDNSSGSDFHATVNSFARFMRDIADSGEEGQRFASEQMSHISSTIQNSMPAEVREAVERIEQRRELMNI